MASPTPLSDRLGIPVETDRSATPLTDRLGAHVPVGATVAIAAALDFERALLEVQAMLDEVPDDLVHEASCRYLVESRDTTLADEVRRALREKILEMD